MTTRYAENQIDEISTAWHDPSKTYLDVLEETGLTKGQVAGVAYRWGFMHRRDLGKQLIGDNGDD